MSKIETHTYNMNFNQLTQQIRQTHEALQSYAVKAINIGLTIRNWLIGCYIVEYEQNGEDRANYGEHLLENVSVSLLKQGLKNVSAAELSRFRQFYNIYPQIFGTLSQKSLKLPKQILGTVSQELSIPAEKPLIDPLELVSNLSFSHFAELIKIDNELKRSFYEIECIKGTWGVRELRRQINSLFFERMGLSRKPEKLIELVQSNAQKITVSEIIKSPYTFEFLGIAAKDVVFEADLEQAIMDNIQHFLLEMGNGYCFEARQKKILIEDEYFFIDLVFYHRILHCHVLIDIKTDKFNHGYIGQLNAYLEHYKHHEMHEGDNLPVGILLVTDKNNTLVEYATGTLDNQIFVSRYLLELPQKEVLEKIVEKEANSFCQK
ncbi:MAG: PDDEXK nuclease domain-containing protein [Candidatus Azobacteroides sp.]|nr:PDDEXK nuclease domain-containing protein [Candidatus Azobacteroides sp.]